MVSLFISFHIDLLYLLYQNHILALRFRKGPPKDVYAYLGEDVKIEVKVPGSPSLRVSWLNSRHEELEDTYMPSTPDLKSKRVKSPSQTWIQKIFSNSTVPINKHVLNLRNIQKFDEGLYSCSISNEKDEDSRAFYVHVDKKLPGNIHIFFYYCLFVSY